MRKAIYTIVSLFLLAACGRPSVPSQFRETDRDARIFPDYSGVVIPCNIAPMNFIVHEGAESYVVSAACGEAALTVSADGDGKVDFPEAEWRSLAAASKGKDLEIGIYARRDGEWERYRKLRMTVAADSIDPYVSYRLIEPGYEVYRQLGLYQRNLTNFCQNVIYENNRSFDSSHNHCVNCHNFQSHSTRNMLFHIRGTHGGTMLVRDGKAEKMNMKSDSVLSSTVYPAWHPKRKWVVFSSNKTGQIFHTLDKQKIEVLDMASDLVFFDAESNSISNILKTDTDFETFPCWNPAGDTLYYCVARVPGLATVPDSERVGYLEAHYKNLHYNIMKMSFDAKTRTFGEPQMVLDCEAIRKSATVPRVSADGRYLLFTLADYGQFHIWHRSADLYVMDLLTGEMRPLSKANSKDTESYHAWSSGGRWIVFTSRRDDGSYTRLYISYFDREGRDHKAFLMPQRDPEQNVLLLKSYNVPEFSSDAVSVPFSEFRDIVYNTEGTPVTYRPLGK